jgi:hypothetical protein
MAFTAPSYWLGRTITLHLGDGHCLRYVRVTAASDAEQWIEVHAGDRVRRLPTAAVARVEPTDP